MAGGARRAMNTWGVFGAEKFPENFSKTTTADS
jgi:hypothetical protein